MSKSSDSFNATLSSYQEQLVSIIESFKETESAINSLRLLTHEISNQCLYRSKGTLSESEQKLYQAVMDLEVREEMRVHYKMMELEKLILKAITLEKASDLLPQKEELKSLLNHLYEMKQAA